MKEESPDLSEREFGPEAQLEEGDAEQPSTDGRNAVDRPGDELMTAAEFVSALRARDVTLSVKNGRLQLHPGTAWRTLSPDEAQCCRTFAQPSSRSQMSPYRQFRNRNRLTQSDESEGRYNRKLGMRL